MIFRIFFAWIFFTVAASTRFPLRQRDAYGNIGYEYDVKHPLGNSRVHVHTGNKNRNENHNLHAAASHHVPYRVPVNYGSTHNKPYHGQFVERVPVYEDHSFHPRPTYFEQIPPEHQFSSHGRNNYGYHPKQIGLSQQEAVDTELFSVDKIPPAVGHGYSSPPIVQQVAVDDSFEKSDPPPIVQQISDDEPFDKILVDRVGPTPVIQQKSDDTPIIFTPPVSQVPLDSKFEPPLIQQTVDLTPDIAPAIKTDPVHTELSQQAVIDVSPPDAKTDIILQQNLEDQPVIVQVAEDGPVQQEFIDESSVEHNPIPITQQQTLVDIDEKVEKPIFQTSIDPHLSQISDSPIKSFTGIKNPPPRSSYIDQPQYHFIPVGHPYEKISHSTEIIHGAPHHLYRPPAPLPRKYTKPNNQYFVKSHPVIQPVKYPHPKKHFPVDPAFTKNTPLSYSHKFPPQSQEPILLDLPYTKTPPKPHSVKNFPYPQKTLSIAPPPPPPISHSIKLPPQTQEHILVDLPHTKSPPKPFSVKLPPQEILVVDPPPPSVPHSVKLPPQTQEPILVDLSHTKTPPKPFSVKLPPQEILVVDPPPPAVSHSVKLPPQTQEPILVDLSHTKTPPKPISVKLPPQEILVIDPPPPFVSHSVKLPPQTQEPILVDLSHTKTPPNPISVKLPPQEILVVDPPPPAVVHSIKLPPQTQEPILVDLSHTKTPPKPVSVKLPPQEHVLVDLPHTKTLPKPHSVKLPPQTASLIDRHPPPVWHSHKHPNPVSAKHSNAATLIDSSDFGEAPLVLHDGPSEIIHPPFDHSDVPDTSIISDDSPHIYLDNPHISGPPQEKPLIPNPRPVSHAVLLPSVISSSKPKITSPEIQEDNFSKVDTVELKNLQPTIEEIELKKISESSDPTSVPNLFAAVPAKPDDVISTSDINTPVSHAIRLPLPQSSSVSSPVSDVLVSGPVHSSNILRNPLSHPVPRPVRLNIHGPRGSFSRGTQGAPKIGENNIGETSKDDFPAFPVKSALEQDDPVRDKVANSGLSFGDRLPGRSRSFHK